MQMNKVKGVSQNGVLTREKIDDIITSKVSAPPRQIKIPNKIISKYFAVDVTRQERDTVIDKALEK